MKTRNIMYVQQIDKLPVSVDDLIHQAHLMANKYAYIIHDKDVDSNGKLVKPHIHLIMSFKNPHSITSIAKHLKDSPERIESMSKYGSNGFNNSISYLVHHSNGSFDKYQYDPKDVIANFDYPSELKNIEESVNDSKRHSKIHESQLVSDVLQRAGAGLLTINQTRKELLNISAKALATNSTTIDKLFKELAEIKFGKWSKEKQDSKEPITIIWIYGSAGVGKTRFAKQLAHNKSGKTFISGSSNDPFQGYDGESNLILDELRPNTFKYEDLLRMLDPWSYDSMTSARYRNTHLMANIIIITTPFNPLQFYLKISNNKTDSFNQLLRRLSLILEIDSEYITSVTFDTATRKFIKNYQDKEINMYSEKVDNHQMNLKQILSRKE